jgi:hypothetical protein
MIIVCESLNHPRCLGWKEKENENRRRIVYELWLLFSSLILPSLFRNHCVGLQLFHRNALFLSTFFTLMNGWGLKNKGAVKYSRLWE